MGGGPGGSRQSVTKCHNGEGIGKQKSCFRNIVKKTGIWNSNYLAGRTKSFKSIGEPQWTAGLVIKSFLVYFECGLNIILRLLLSSKWRFLLQYIEFSIVLCFSQLLISLKRPKPAAQRGHRGRQFDMPDLIKA